MRRISVLFALSLAPASFAAPAEAQSRGCEGSPGAGKVRLDVVATNLRNGKGEVAFTVYADDRKRFLAKGGKLARIRVPAAAPTTTACFRLPAGRYAIAIYHDENADHDFNRTLWMPKEGFGFSNDAPTTLGLPSLDKVRFMLPAGGTTVRIRMRYRR